MILGLAHLYGDGDDDGVVGRDVELMCCGGR